MGNIKSIEYLEVSAPSRPGEWILEAQLPYCSVLRNTQTGYLAEEYIVPKDPHTSLLKSFQIYDYRRKQNRNLVEVYQAEKEPSSYLCQGAEFLRVKTQRISHRLSQFGILQLNEAFYILFTSLIGYKTIYEFNGPWFTPSGKVKVWINSNFAKNSSESQLSLGKNDQTWTQKSMVDQILDLVKDHLQTKDYPQDFLYFYNKFSPQTFVASLQIIQNYMRHRNITMPQSIIYQSNQSLSSFSSIQVNLKDLKEKQRGSIQPTAHKSLIQQPFMSCGLMNNSEKIVFRNPTITENQQNLKFSNTSSGLKVPNNETQSTVKTIPIVVDKIGNRQPTIQSFATSESENKPQPFTFTFHQIKPKPIHQYELNKDSLKNSKSSLSIQKYHSPSKYVKTVNSKPLQNPYYVNSFGNSNIKNYPLPHTSQQKVLSSPRAIQNVRPLGFQERVFNSKIIPNGIPTRDSKNSHSVQKKSTEVYFSRHLSPQVNNFQQQVSQQPKYNFAPSVINTPKVSYPNTTGDRRPVQNKPSIISRLNFQNKILEQNRPKQVKNDKLISPRSCYYSGIVQNQVHMKNRQLLCTTQIDSVRPEIRKMMISSPITQSNQNQLSNLPSQIFKQDQQQIQPLKNQILKQDLLQMKQQQIKNYLVGHSQSNPIKDLENNQYFSSFKSLKKQNIPLNQLKIQQASNEQSLTFKELDRVMDSLNESLMRTQTPIAHIVTTKKDSTEGNSSHQRVQVMDFDNKQDQDIEISDIETIVHKNFGLIQDHIFTELDELDETLKKQSQVPSYEEMRSALLYQNSLRDGFNLKSD